VPLQLISSKVAGIPLLNSGLSRGQREKHRTHHLFCVILLRNIPMFVIECYLMFNLGIYSVMAIVAFLATLFSFAVCAATMLDFYVVNRRHIELPFTIKLQWATKREHAVCSDAVCSDSSPLSRVGRRQRLALVLQRRFESKLSPLQDVRFRVEVMSTSTADESEGVLIHGMIAGLGAGSERLVTEIVDGLEDEEMARDIHRAVMVAFALKPFAKDYEFAVTASSKGLTSDSDSASDFDESDHSDIEGECEEPPESHSTMHHAVQSAL